MPITADLKKKHLKSLSLALRHELEGRYEKGEWQAGDLEQRLMSLGVRRERAPLPLDEMAHLPEYDHRARKIVDEYIALRTASGMSQKDAVAEYVRETAYTWANRLLALRCMEARELIDEVILQKEVYGGRSLEHNRLLRARPELSSQDDDGLFLVLEQAFARMAQHLPLLFDPHAPSIALRPTPAALKRCIAMLSGTVSVRAQESVDESVFKEPDALGWAYQFWNSEEKDRVFESVRTQKAKIAGADIVPATQLYTEPYMVKFLVQNSLGATWLGMYPESKLPERWEYFVRDADRAPIAQEDRKAVSDLSFLDPACGSGHFLLEAFDLLFDMYKEEGAVTDETAICKNILEKNLYGIDIDERAVQIAEAALWMKAKERAFDFSSARTNLVATNLRLPKDKNHLKAFLDKHPEDKPLDEALQAVFTGLENADQIGTLLQVAEPVEKKLRAIKEEEDKKQLAYLGKPQRTFFDAAPKSADPSMKQFDVSPQTVLPVGVENWEVWRKRTGERLRAHFAEEAEAADLGQQFFSAQASRGWRLFELLGHRYDVVAANPPYMGSKNMGPVLRKYVEQHYPTGKRDLYAAFILRCVELCVASGRMAMVMPQTWMFLRSFAELRAPEEPAETKKPSGKFSGILRQTAIEALAQLGRHAFTEADPPSNVTMLVLAVRVPSDEHRLACFRVNASRAAEQQAESIRSAAQGSGAGISFRPVQRRFLTIPQSPLCYWLRERFFEIFAQSAINKTAVVTRQVMTCNNDRFVRTFWEAPQTGRWVPYLKGGGYGKWAGFEHWSLDWKDGIRLRNELIEKFQYLKGKWDWLVKIETMGIAGWTFSRVARNGLGARSTSPLDRCDNSSPVVIPLSPLQGLGSVLNCRSTTYLLRAVTTSLTPNESYIGRLPLPEKFPEQLGDIELACCSLKNRLLANDYAERKFKYFSPAGKSLIETYRNTYVQKQAVVALLHDLEGKSEAAVFSAYHMTSDDNQAVLAELGVPVGWFPQLNGYDGLISAPAGSNLPVDMHLLSRSQKNLTLSSTELGELKRCLRSSFESGPGTNQSSDDREFSTEESSNDDENEEVLFEGNIPIPAETFLEELSQKFEIHPISVYWLLKEGIEKEGWRCRPEEQRFVSDQFTVTILRLLGHRWPRQVEAGEPVPEWADPDGIIPLTAGTHEATLYDRVRDRIAADFPGGDVAGIEREFAEIMGKPLDRWIESDFFKHHTQQFKKRPIAWQIQSGKFTAKRKPAFACLVYYHKLDGDTLPKLRSQYVGPLRARLETELRGIEALPKDSRSARQQARQTELLDQLSELRDFDQRLEQVSARGFASAKLAEEILNEPLDSYSSSDGVRPPPADHAAFVRQEESYTPDLNDGVRVNIAPLQKAGLLAADVLAGKDLDKAVADRAVWRSDERRWTRAGKLPRPGYWPVPDAADEPAYELAQPAADMQGS